MRVTINFELNDLVQKHWERSTVPSDISTLIQEVVHRLSAAGVDQVNWRGTVGGKAMYHSNVLQRFDGIYHLAGEPIGAFMEEQDPLRIFVDACRVEHISPWVWLDAFDAYVPGMHEAVFERHPSWLLIAREGGSVLPGVPCYSEPGVRRYRLGQMAELSHYGIDGIVYSLFNSHAGPYLTGYLGGGQNAEPYSYGFNDSIVNAYYERHGINIRTEPFNPQLWAELQAEQFGDYLQEIHDMLAKSNQALDLVIRRDDHVAGSQYPACYIANTYRQWHDRDVCDRLIIEGVACGQSEQEAARMVDADPSLRWGLWHTLWAGWASGIPANETDLLIDSVIKDGRYELFCFHEVDSIEFSLQGGTKTQAYERLGDRVCRLKSAASANRQLPQDIHHE